jgi:hypothetical protein
MAKHEPTVRLEDRVTLCDTVVTLDGKRARVSGYNNPFATVTQLDTGYSVEFAWETVRRVVVFRGGAFRG